MRVLLLTDRGEVHQGAAIRAAPAGLELEVLRAPSPERLCAEIAAVEVVISERNQPINAEAIARAPHLKLIVRLGSLLQGIDLEAADRRGIPVSLQPVETSVNAAEHVLMMMLALSRRLRRAIADMEALGEQPEPHRTDEDHFAYNWRGYADLGNIHGSTIGVLGMGEIGVELARRLAPLGPRKILYYKRARYPDAIERALSIEYTSAGRCVEEADIVVSLMPHSKVLADLFDRMQPSGLLVHAGSGGMIDERSLADALRSRKIAGAALDTYELEPLPAGSPLRVLAHDPSMNLMLTPHIASGTSGDRAADFEEVVRLIEGRALGHVVTNARA